MGFCSLQHIRNRRSTARELCLPATFRLQGLATLLAAFSRRLRAGFFSHRQRSWDSPFGAFPSDKVSGAFPPERTHLPFCAAVVPAAEAVSRPGRPRFLGFIPCRSPWRQQQVLVALPLGAPVGFALPGRSNKALIRIPPDLLSRAFSTEPQVILPTGAPEYRSAFVPAYPRLRVTPESEGKQPS
jgi:hypothetical protein